jgi:hypothetical protein
MAKHAIPPRYTVPAFVRPTMAVMAALVFIICIIITFVTDGSRAYAARPIHDAKTCAITVTLPSTYVMEYDNSERPLPNRVTAKIKSNNRQCAISAHYSVVNEYAEVMATFVVKPFAKRVHFTLYPGSGTRFFAHPVEHPIFEELPTAYVLGMRTPLVVNSSNVMAVYFARVGANP